METISSAQSFNFSTLNYWISLLSIFSTILLGVFGALGLILGFLVWKQNEMRKNAEKEMERIGKLSKEMEKLYRYYLEEMKSVKEMMVAAKKVMESADKKSKEMDVLIAGIKGKGEEIEGVRQKIDDLRIGLRQDYNSLTTVSGMIPDHPSKVDFMADYVAGTGGLTGTTKEYSPDTIKRAIELLEKMK